MVGHCNQNCEALALFPMGKWLKCFLMVYVHYLHLLGHAPGDIIVVNKRLQYNQQQIEIVSDYSYLGVERTGRSWCIFEKYYNKEKNKNTG